MKRIRKGDDVMVIAGSDKGRRGTVLKVLGDDRLLVEGIKMVKKHRRGNPNRNVTGGIVEQEAAIHVSNVMLFNSVSGRPERVGFKHLEDGNKVRFFRKDGEVVDV